MHSLTKYYCTLHPQNDKVHTFLFHLSGTPNLDTLWTLNQTDNVLIIKSFIINTHIIYRYIFHDLFYQDKLTD